MGTNEIQYRIVFTNDAIIEMDNINHYITENLYNFQAANRLMKKVEKVIYDLKDMPRKYAVIKKFEELNLEYRRIVINHYTVLYTIDEEEKTVYIVHMYYGERNFLNYL